MPGKVNPVIPEAVAMVAAQVIGNDAAIAFAGASGNFQLNVMMPLMARNILEQITLLTRAAEALGERAVAGMAIDADHMRQAVESSGVLATALVPLIGYERAAALVAQAQEEDTSLADVITRSGLVAQGVITAQEVDRALDVGRLTQPPRP